MRCLHRIAEAAGEELTAVSLYIGGCTLHRHYLNMLTGKDVFGIEFSAFDVPVSPEEAALAKRCVMETETRYSIP